MKVNTKVRYGFKALAYIAVHASENRLVRIKEIAEAQKISVQYLEQILYKLKNEKIIEGKRGPSGGYRLLKKPKDITLHTIYMILDDEVKVIDCNENEEHKKRCKDGECPDCCIWSKLDTALTKILSDTSLEDFIKTVK